MSSASGSNSDDYNPDKKKKKMTKVQFSLSRLLCYFGTLIQNLSSVAEIQTSLTKIGRRKSSEKLRENEENEKEKKAVQAAKLQLKTSLKPK